MALLCCACATQARLDASIAEMGHVRAAHARERAADKASFEKQTQAQLAETKAALASMREELHESLQREKEQDVSHQTAMQELEQRHKGALEDVVRQHEIVKGKCDQVGGLLCGALL